MLPALEEESLLMCYQKSGLGPYGTESYKPDHECQRIQQVSPAGWKYNFSDTHQMYKKMHS